MAIEIAILLNRFFSKIKKQENGCWIWQGSKTGKTRNGHAQIWNGEKLIGVHRFSYETFNGPIPDGLLVRHTCDTPCCVNPLHLVTGTVQDNSDDCVARDRQAKGERNGNSRHSEELIRKIYADPRSSRKIAADLHVSQCLVVRVKSRKIWKHLNYA